MSQAKPEKPILITDFTGQAENPHIGFGVSVGMDLYTTKGVARLSRKLDKTSGSTVTGLPVYASIADDQDIWVQDSDGKVYTSTDDGLTWAQVAGNTVDGGKGLIIWEDYVFSFTADDIDLYGPLSGAPAWRNNWWTTTAAQPVMANAATVTHFPFAYGATLYFLNDNLVASITVVGTFVWNNGATYIPDPAALTMAWYYRGQSMALLPPNNIAISVINQITPSASDLVIWDRVSPTSIDNIVTLPGASDPVKQLMTKNGILYAVTNNEHGIYTVNGTSAEVVDRLSLRMSNRESGGKQYTTRLQSPIYVSGIDFIGPELLTAGSNTPSPISQIANTGLYPYGVWSVNTESGLVCTRFPLSHGDINAQYTGAYAIGLIKTLRNNTVIVGWQRGSNYGIDTLNTANYISTASHTFVESELFEVGTRTEPRTFNNLEYNLVAPLGTGEEIQFYYRLNQLQDYTALGSSINLASLGSNLSGIITPLPFEKCRYIQIGFTMKANSNSNQTPQMRTVWLN